MSRERRRKHHRHSSAQEKHVRFWTILVIVMALALFGVAIYGVNRWLNPAAG